MMKSSRSFCIMIILAGAVLVHGYYDLPEPYKKPARKPDPQDTRYDKNGYGYGKKDFGRIKDPWTDWNKHGQEDQHEPKKKGHQDRWPKTKHHEGLK